jgi:hypothetical protein
LGSVINDNDLFVAPSLRESGLERFSNELLRVVRWNQDRDKRLHRWTVTRSV